MATHSGAEWPVVGRTYRHYKGNLYRVLNVAQMSNTDQEGAMAVVYESLNPQGRQAIHVRTLGSADGWAVPTDAGEVRFVLEPEDA